MKSVSKIPWLDHSVSGMFVHTRALARGETMALENGADAHGEKDTTRMSSEQERNTQPRVNAPEGKARGLVQDLVSRATPALGVAPGGTG